MFLRFSSVAASSASRGRSPPTGPVPRPALLPAVRHRRVPARRHSDDGGPRPQAGAGRPDDADEGRAENGLPPHPTATRCRRHPSAARRTPPHRHLRRPSAQHHHAATAPVIRRAVFPSTACRSANRVPGTAPCTAGPRGGVRPLSTTSAGSASGSPPVRSGTCSRTAPVVQLVHQHDMGRVMARTISQTLELSEGDTGLRVWASLDPQITYVADLARRDGTRRRRPDVVRVHRRPRLVDDRA